MSTFTKDEINAKLALNKAEVDKVAAEMRTDMAKWREQMSHDLSEMSKSTERVAQGFENQYIKLDSAIQIQSGKLEKSISDAKIETIKWVLGLPALAFTIWKIYEALPSK